MPGNDFGRAGHCLSAGRSGQAAAAGSHGGLVTGDRVDGAPSCEKGQRDERPSVVGERLHANSRSCALFSASTKRWRAVPGDEFIEAWESDPLRVRCLSSIWRERGLHHVGTTSFAPALLSNLQ